MLFEDENSSEATLLLNRGDDGVVSSFQEIDLPNDVMNAHSASDSAYSVTEFIEYINI